MFSSRKAVVEIDDVPTKWIFEHYLRLQEKLTGQDVRIKSIFNEFDNDPSMYVFFSSKTNDYRFKCFSTGKTGSGIDLVKHLYDLNYRDAVLKLVDEYKAFLNKEDYVSTPVIPVERWSIDSYKTRSWTTDDAKYWTQFNIGSKLLEKYNVKPLAEYVLSRGMESFSRRGSKVYGYFNANDDLCKIYQPGSEKKFLMIKNYIQGWDQIEGKELLLVCSSLKDIMSIKSLGIECDCVAPNSENSGIDSIVEWIKAYPKKYIIFDNDTAGIKAMERCKKDYGIPFLHVDLSKDISDSIRDHGAKKVKEYLKEHL
jgi:hypothetical protein